MSFIRTQKRENPFVQVDKHVLENESLSFAAKGLMAYILSKPDSWTIRTTDLIKRSKDGKTKIQTALLELMANGYLNWYQTREADGTMGEWVYDVYERPEFNPEAEKWIKDGLERLNKRSKKNSERNKERVKKLNEELIIPKADNQSTVPKADYPTSDYPTSDNQPYSNNELELNIYSINKEEEEEEEEEDNHRMVVSVFKENFEVCNAKIEKDLRQWLNVLPIEIIINEIEHAAKNGAKSFPYVEKALLQDLSLQIESIEQLENKRKNHTSKKRVVSTSNRLKKDEKALEWIAKQKEQRKSNQTPKDEITPEFEAQRQALLLRLGVAAN